MTEGKQVKKIVDDIALLPEYVWECRKQLAAHKGVSPFGLPILEQYAPAWESQHFREDDQLVKTATASYL